MGNRWDVLFAIISMASIIVALLALLLEPADVRRLGRERWANVRSALAWIRKDGLLVFVAVESTVILLLMLIELLRSPR